MKKVLISLFLVVFTRSPMYVYANDTLHEMENVYSTKNISGDTVEFLSEYFASSIIPNVYFISLENGYYHIVDKKGTSFQINSSRVIRLIIHK